MTVARTCFSTEAVAGAGLFEPWRSSDWPGFPATFEAPGNRGEVADNLAVERARRFIDATLTRPEIAVADIVVAMHVSRATAYRLFGPCGGLAKFRLERKLIAAHRDVLDAGASLGDIAETYGFSDHSHFTKAFRTRYGFPPSALRV